MESSPDAMVADAERQRASATGEPEGKQGGGQAPGERSSANRRRKVRLGLPGDEGLGTSWAGSSH